MRFLGAIMKNTVTTIPAKNKFTVKSGQSILQAATEQGVQLPYGCGNGFCGACKAQVVSGATSYLDDYQPEPLSESELSEGFILCCKATTNSNTEIKVDEIPVAINPAQNFTSKLVNIKQVCSNVIILRLNLGEDNHMQYSAGQYVEFALDNNKTRSFSIANMPNDSNEIEFHIKHNPDGEFTNRLFNQEIKLNDLIDINGPLGTFFIKQESTKPIVLIATGTGFAPIKAMVEQLLSEDSTRPIKFYWGVRSEKDLYLLELVKDWQQHDNFSFIPVLSRPEEDWLGESGYVIPVVCEQNPDLPKYEIYLAGAPEMIKDAQEAFKKLGVPKDNICSDSFEHGE